MVGWYTRGSLTQLFLFNINIIAAVFVVFTAAVIFFLGGEVINKLIQKSQLNKSRKLLFLTSSYQHLTKTESRPLWEPGINQRQPLSTVASSSASHRPTTRRGAHAKYDASWCGITTITWHWQMKSTKSTVDYIMFCCRHTCVRAGRHTVSYWSTYGSDDSLAGYQATATEELTADCCDRQRQSSS